MFMTATRKKIEGKPVLKLNLHNFPDEDIPFLESLGIDQIEGDAQEQRFTFIHSQEDFLETRGALLEKYTILKEVGPKVFLAPK